MTVLWKIFLALALLFLFLWRRTPPESRYETVELEIVSTRKVFLVLAVVMFGFFAFTLVLSLKG
jgi:drug/metabolite transporter (DMT)-like permease